MLPLIPRATLPASASVRILCASIVAVYRSAHIQLRSSQMLYSWLSCVIASLPTRFQQFRSQELFALILRQLTHLCSQQTIQASTVQKSTRYGNNTRGQWVEASCWDLRWSGGSFCLRSMWAFWHISGTFQCYIACRVKAEGCTHTIYGGTLAIPALSPFCSFVFAISCLPSAASWFTSILT